MIEALDQQTVALEVGSEIVSSLSRLMSFVQGPENTLPYEIYGTRARSIAQSGTRFRSALRGEVPLVLAEPALTAYAPCRCGCSCSPSAC